MTSPAREDKDAVAANLAVALAQSGQSTVLVCADLRWGQAHRLFEVNDTEGITGILDGQTSLADALEPVAPGLKVLPAGPPPLDASAVLQRPDFRAMLSALLGRADFVVITAPPVLASADALILADIADMTLLVADARHSARAQVRTAMRVSSSRYTTRSSAACLPASEGAACYGVPGRRRPPGTASPLPRRSMTIGRPETGSFPATTMAAVMALDNVEPAPPRAPTETPGTHEDAREDDKWWSN